LKLIAHFRETMNPPVFFGAVGLILVFVVFGAAFTEVAQPTFESVQAFIVTNFGWFYILSATGLLVFVLWIAIGRFGRIYEVRATSSVVPPV
jgi:choline/glycine/proline betaine transport protein